MEVYGALPDWVAVLMQQVEATPNAKITSAELRSLGISPERVRRWFGKHYGMTRAACSSNWSADCGSCRSKSEWYESD